MRIVGEDGPSGRCPRPGHDPVVRANAIPLRLSFGEEAVEIMRLRSLQRRGEADLLGGELVIQQDVFWHRAGVQSGRHCCGPRRFELDAQLVGLKPRRTGDLRSAYLRAGIPGQTMAADPHDVLGTPQIRLTARQLELGRKRTRALPDLLHERIHTGDERFGVALRMRAVGCPLPIHVATIQEQVDMSARAGLKKPSAAVAARTNWRENGIDFLRSFWALSQASICHAAAVALNCAALAPAM